MYRILIVEDEPMIAEGIKTILTQSGYKVIAIINNGEEAIEKAEELKPDLVLMDIVLSGKISGIKAGEKIFKEFNIPIIFLTAFADDKTVNSAKSANPYGYIVKPFDPEELYATIEIALVKHKAEKELEESRAKFRSMFMGNPEPSVYLDKDYNIADINPRFSEYFYYTIEEVKGKNIDTLIIPDEKLKEAEDLNQKMEQGYVYHDTFRKHKDGTLVPVSISAASILVNGKSVGSFVIYKDISKQKKAEDEREKVIIDLQKALDEVKALSGLIPICSHCKKIRDDSGYWEQVEYYISKRSGVDFSHSICPECMKKYYPKQYEKLKEKGKI
ncbi:MAG: response regulator [Candidatus Cloacimonetes bacterium]|nr:response regulator [Candidatus Cloacimonadota bacterium]